MGPYKVMQRRHLCNVHAVYNAVICCVSGPVSDGKLRALNNTLSSLYAVRAFGTKEQEATQGSLEKFRLILLVFVGPVYNAL